MSIHRLNPDREYTVAPETITSFAPAGMHCATVTGTWDDGLRRDWLPIIGWAVVNEDRIVPVVLHLGQPELADRVFDSGWKVDGE